MGIWTFSSIIYFINTNYTNSVKPFHFFYYLLLNFYISKCQIELGFSKIGGSAELNINFSENFFNVCKMMRSSSFYEYEIIFSKNKAQFFWIIVQTLWWYSWILKMYCFECFGRRNQWYSAIRAVNIYGANGTNCSDNEYH